MFSLGMSSNCTLGAWKVGLHGMFGFTTRYVWVHGTFLPSVPEHILDGIPWQRGGEPVFNIDNACTYVGGKEGDRVRIKTDAELDRCE